MSDENSPSPLPSNNLIEGPDLDIFKGDIDKLDKVQKQKFCDLANKPYNGKIEYIMYEDLTNRMLSQSITEFTKIYITPIIKKCLTNNYVLLLFLDHGIAILVRKVNIKHCKMIYEASNMENGFAPPTMLLNTPIVDCSLYAESLHSNKLISIFQTLVTDRYYNYSKDDISIAFYKAIGFDVDKHICLEVDGYGSDDD